MLDDKEQCNFIRKKTKNECESTLKFTRWISNIPLIMSGGFTPFNAVCAVANYPGIKMEIRRIQKSGGKLPAGIRFWGSNPRVKTENIPELLASYVATRSSVVVAISNGLIRLEGGTMKPFARPITQNVIWQRQRWRVCLVRLRFQDRNFTDISGVGGFEIQNLSAPPLNRSGHQPSS